MEARKVGTKLHEMELAAQAMGLKIIEPDLFAYAHNKQWANNYLIDGFMWLGFCGMLLMAGMVTYINPESDIMINVMRAGLIYGLCHFIVCGYYMYKAVRGFKP